MEESGSEGEESGSEGDSDVDLPSVDLPSDDEDL
jgi:hypothetical protein